MSIIYVLIPLSLLSLIIALAVFFWAIKNEQFEDLEGPAYKIIFDDRKQRETVKKHDNG